MRGPVIHWEIGARDAMKVRHFYAELFGWRIEGAPDYGLVAPEDGGIGGGIMQMEPGVPPRVMIYVGVDDLDRAVARAHELGAQTLVPPTAITGIGAFAVVADPEGNPVGLMVERSGASS
jgi:predicted enzyme related to lactoylglutathione lyase